MFMLPGLEGAAAVMEPLCRRLKTKVCVLQLGVEHPNEDIEAMVNRLYLVSGSVGLLQSFAFGIRIQQ